MSNGRITAHVQFYQIEMDLWHAERSWLEMLAVTCANQLDAKGAIGPYQYWCEPSDGRVSPHVFRAMEL